MRGVADSSSLISLSVVDALWLLPHFFETTIIPPAVYQEVVVEGEGKPGAKEVKEAKWITVLTPSPEKVAFFCSQGLGLGEVEALALVAEGEGDVILTDDERAWQVAQKHNLSFLRSLELLLEAHRRNLLTKEKIIEKVQQLRQKGWLSPKVAEIAIQQIKKTNSF